MRKATLISLLLVALLALAACGGGGSSSSGGSTSGGSTSEGGSTASSAEEAWTEEVTAVMTEFENKVTPTVVEPIHTSTSQQHLEPLYGTYSIDLAVLGKKLEGTEAPPACVAVRKKMAADVRQVSVLTKALSSNPKLSPEQYAQKAYEKGLKIDKLGHALGALTTEPNC